MNKEKIIPLSQAINQRPNKLLTIIFVIFVFVALSITGALIYQINRLKILNQAVTQKPCQLEGRSSPQPSADLTDSWKTYSNKDYGISFEYPANWDILILTGVSDPLPFLYNELYFIKKINNDSTFTPSLFSIQLFINKGETVESDSTFITWLNKRFPQFFNIQKEIKKNPQQFSPTTKLGNIKLGDKTAIRYEEISGMFYGHTMVSWVSKKELSFWGQLDFHHTQLKSHSLN